VSPGLELRWTAQPQKKIGLLKCSVLMHFQWCWCHRYTGNIQAVKSHLKLQLPMISRWPLWNECMELGRFMPDQSLLSLYTQWICISLKNAR